jgi:hypothetical protein
MRSICASVSENEEKRCYIHWFKRTFSQLSSRLCFGYLYSLPLKIDASVATCYKQVRGKEHTKSTFGATPTSASRRRISDLRLPFLIEPGHRKLSASPTPIMKRGVRALSLTVRGIGPAVELTYSMFISDIRLRHECPVNLPLDTARHALVHHRDQFTAFAKQAKMSSRTNLAACAPHPRSS